MAAAIIYLRKVIDGAEQRPCKMNEMLFLHTNTTNENAFNGTLNPIYASKTHRRCKCTRSPNAFSRNLVCGIFCASCRCIGTCELETTKYSRCFFSLLFFFSILVSFGRLLASVENAVLCYVAASPKWWHKSEREDTLSTHINTSANQCFGSLSIC